MFDDDFSFDPSRSSSVVSADASSTGAPSRSVSPNATVGPLPMSQISIADLAAQFSHQRIRRTANISYDSCEAYANNDSDADWQIPSPDEDANDQLHFPPIARSRTAPLPRPHSPSQRMQRQANARLLCSRSHHRDIAALVARMVEANDQCSVAPQEMPPAIVEDEGYKSGDGLTPIPSHSASISASRPRLDYRRRSEIMSGGACVSKSARFRRERTGPRRPSADPAS